MVFYLSLFSKSKKIICVVSDPSVAVFQSHVLKTCVFFHLTTIKPPSAAPAQAGKQFPASLQMYCGTWMISLRAMQRARRCRTGPVADESCPSCPPDRRCAGASAERLKDHTGSKRISVSCAGASQPIVLEKPSPGIMPKKTTIWCT